MLYKHQIAALVLSFILGSHNGCIAIWKDGSAQPVKVFPYLTEMLPLTDQIALKKGIRIDSDLKLAEFLEDYLS